MNKKIKYLFIVLTHYAIFLIIGFAPLKPHNPFTIYIFLISVISSIIFMIYSFYNKRWIAGCLLLIYSIIVFVIGVGLKNGL